MKSLKKPELTSKWNIPVRDLLKGVALTGFLAFFFYRSAKAFIPMLLPASWFVWWEQKKKEDQRRKRLLQQFAECIMSVAGSVKAGYAVENAFLESMKDMEMMFGREAEILKELQYIKGGLINHVSLERLLEDVGMRTGLEEVEETAQMLAITRRNGGSLAEVVSMISGEIRDRIILKEEMDTVLASKRLEQKIMNGMPFLLVLYLEGTTPGYFEMFFGNLEGVLLMSGFLLWYIAAYAISEAILWRLCR